MTTGTEHTNRFDADFDAWWDEAGAVFVGEPLTRDDLTLVFGAGWASGVHACQEVGVDGLVPNLLEIVVRFVDKIRAAVA